MVFSLISLEPTFPLKYGSEDVENPLKDYTFCTSRGIGMKIEDLLKILYTSCFWTSLHECTLSILWFRIYGCMLSLMNEVKHWVTFSILFCI